MTMTHDLSGTILVLGGARSGKSNFAESLFESCGSAAYLATAEALDTEMTARIERHQSRRGNKWTTLEEPVDIRAAIARTPRWRLSSGGKSTELLPCACAAVASGKPVALATSGLRDHVEAHLAHAGLAAAFHYPFEATARPMFLLTEGPLL